MNALSWQAPGAGAEESIRQAGRVSVARVGEAAPPAAFDEAQLRKLLKASAKGDASAFEKLYDLTIGRCYALALHITGHEGMAEAATERFYAALWPAAGELAGRSDGLATEVLRRCRQHAIAAVPCGDGNTAVPPTPDLLATLAPDAPLRARLERLDPASRMVVALAFLRGMSYPAIATHLAMDVAQVKALARGAVGALRG